MKLFQRKRTEKQIIQSVLQDLLQYEGGEVQSLSEWARCSASNTRLIEYAKVHGIELDLSQIDRNK